MTNKWMVDTRMAFARVFIIREADDIPIAEMVVSSEDGDGLLSEEEATDIAAQIVDDWNFSCDVLEN